MLLSAAGVAFTPTLRPHVAQQTARAAVVCGLEAPVPPAAVVVLEAATHQVCTTAAHHGVGWLTLTPTLTRGPSLNRSLVPNHSGPHVRPLHSTHAPYHPVALRRRPTLGCERQRFAAALSEAPPKRRRFCSHGRRRRVFFP